jgi:hypothetical protein
MSSKEEIGTESGLIGSGKRRAILRAISGSQAYRSSNGAGRESLHDPASDDGTLNLSVHRAFSSGRPVVDIRNHGASAIRGADCTAAIAACAEAGGGRVLVPAGTWSTGPIHLPSNIDLHVAAGAILRFRIDSNRYGASLAPRRSGKETVKDCPCIVARDGRNIADRPRHAAGTVPLLQAGPSAAAHLSGQLHQRAS